MCLVSFLEASASFFTLVNIYLCVKENIWNWFFGILMVIIYAFLFFKVKLYAGMCLQFVVLSLQFYGLTSWLRGANQATFYITRTKMTEWVILIFVSVFSFSTIAFFLRNYTDSNTIGLDALITAASLAAMWLQANKKIEHWIIWFFISMISIEIYLFKHLYVTAGLYVFFIFLNAAGYWCWRKKLLI